MVAFERRMAESQIPEWSTEYVPYGKMKTMLKELVARVSAAEQAAAADDFAANVDLDALESGATDTRDVDSFALKRRESIDYEQANQVSLTGAMAARTRGELLALAPRKGGTGVGGLENTTTNKAGFDALTDITEHAETLVATVIDPENTALLSQAAAQEETRFFTALDDSLRRVVAFYGARASRCKREAASHASQLRHLKHAARRATRDLRESETRSNERARGIEAMAMRRVGSASAIVGDFMKGGKKKMSSGAISDDAVPERGVPHVKTHKPRKPKSLADAKALVLKTAGDARLLRRAVAESYRGANMLESYVSLNVEAFRKIVKKHDKLTGWATQDTYMKGLRELRVFHDDEIGALRVRMEHFYLKIEETLCELEPTRWDRRFGEKGRLGVEDSGHEPVSFLHGKDKDAKKDGKKDKSGGKNLGFYEIRRRRNRVLAELRKDSRAGVVSSGGKQPEGPSFVAGIVLGCAVGLLALLISRIFESCEVGSARSASGYFSRASCAAVTRITPAVRFPLLVATHVIGYGGLVRAWSETKVNAGFIFQAKRGTELPAMGAALSGALAMAVWAAFALGLADIAKVEEGEVDGAGDISKLSRTHVTAGLAFIALCGLFVAPLPKTWVRTQKFCRKHELRYPPDSTRRFFLSALFDGMSAPFTRVKMMDFFLMDQIVSQTTALRDGVLVMLLLVGKREDDSRRHAALIALAPFWLRFLQCLRRFRDDGHNVHLVNAGKYFSALVAVSLGLRVWYAQREVAEWTDAFGTSGVLANGTSVDETSLRAWLDSNPEPKGASHEMRITFIVCQAIATLYGATWDFFMDWSVVSLVKVKANVYHDDDDELHEDVLTGAEGGTRRTNVLSKAQTLHNKPAGVLHLYAGYKLRWLERRTMMKSRWKYGAACVLNLLLRHFWITAAVPGAREGMSLGAEAWVTVVAFTEVLRRCAWSYFRVENEHATNCGMFRATLEVPLPFQDGELTDEEDEPVAVVGAPVSSVSGRRESVGAFSGIVKTLTGTPVKRESPAVSSGGLVKEGSGVSAKFAGGDARDDPAMSKDDSNTVNATTENDKVGVGVDAVRPQLALSEDEAEREMHSDHSDDHSDHSTGSNAGDSDDDRVFGRRLSRRFSLVHSDVSDFDDPSSDPNSDPSSAAASDDADAIESKSSKRLNPPRRKGSRLNPEFSGGAHALPTKSARSRRQSFSFETVVTVPTPPVSQLTAAAQVESPAQQRRSRGLEAIAKLVEHKDLRDSGCDDDEDDDNDLDAGDEKKVD